MNPDRAIFELLPALRGRVPFVELGNFPTRVHELDLQGASRQARLWIKRDDETCLQLHSGCKVRKLEFLLGDAVSRGADTISVLAASGSNFLVSVAAHAKRLGFTTVAILYDQYESETARRMRAKMDELGVKHGRVFEKPFFPILFTLHRMGRTPGVPLDCGMGILPMILHGRDARATGCGLRIGIPHSAFRNPQLPVRTPGLLFPRCLTPGCIEGRQHCGRAGWKPALPYIMPPGGTSPLGCLGFISAALELSRQVANGELPAPDYVLVPVGSCGILAGLLAGFYLSGLPSKVIGVRVVDRIVANPLRVSMLANATLALMRSATEGTVREKTNDAGGGEPQKGRYREVEKLLAVRNPIHSGQVQILDGYFGGEYARRTRKGVRAMQLMESEAGIRLEPTYSAKTFAAALDIVRDARKDMSVLFWCTSPGRC